MRISRILGGIVFLAAGVVALVVSVPAPAIAREPANGIPLLIKAAQFAGYAAPPGYSSAQATFKVPTVRCGSAVQGVAEGVVLDGPEAQDTEAGVAEFCNLGRTYYAYVIINGKGRNWFSVRPGDTVTASASETASLTDVRVQDVTSGAINEVTGRGGSVTSALVGESANTDNAGNFIPPAPFTADRFTDVKIGSHFIGLLSPVAVEWVRGNLTLAKPGRISGSRSFTVTFKHS
jgi:hypothetical protein